MAKTLSELAKTQQSTTVGQAPSGAVGAPTSATIQPTQQIDKSADLVKDIGKMFSTTLQTHQQASEYAGKRVGTDNLVEYKKQMSGIAQLYTDKPRVTSADMAEKTRLEQGIYEAFMQKGAFGDNPLANQGFKDTYAVPATNDLLKNKESNLALKTKLFTNEEIQAIGLEMTLTNGTFTDENVKVWQDRLRDVGQDPQAIWTGVAQGLNSSFTNKFKDGVDSVELTKYLDEGLMSQSAVDNLFNDTYGGFAKRTNGKYSKVDTSITDTAYDSMKKSFNNWVDGYNKEVIGKGKKTKLTIANTNSNINIMNSTPAQALTAVATSGEQLSGAMVRQPNEDWSSDIDNLVKLNTKAETIVTFNSAYINLMNGDKSYSEIMEQDYIITTKQRQVADNLTITVGGTTLSKDDLKKYVDNKLTTDIRATTASGDMDASATLGVNIGLMSTDGYSGGSALKTVDNNIASFNNNGFRTARTSNELVASLHLNSSFINTYSGNNASWISNRTVQDVETYRTNLLQKAETDPTLTEDVILLKLKQKTFSLSEEYKSRNEGSRKVKLLQTTDITEDDLVAGAIFGETTLSHGSFDTMLALAETEGKPILSKDDLVEYSKEKMMEIDPSIVPIFGTSTSFVNPLKSNTSAAQNKVRSNFQSLVNEDLKTFSGKEVSIDDLVDEDNFTTYQFIGLNGEIQTVVNMYKGRKLLMTNIYTPNEFRTGVREYKIPVGNR